MAKYKPQHTRLLFIDRKISEGRYPNCTSLAEEWEVSPKTIHRDLDYMRYQLDAPLEYSARNRGFYYTEPDFKLPAISIKESDLFAIYLAEEMLLQYKGTPFYDSLKSVFQKIEESLPEKTTFKSSRGNARFTVFPPPSTTVCPKVWNTVFKNLRIQNRLELEYQPPGQAVSTRTIDPYHAVRYDGDWYVTGLCHSRNQIRTFSLSRIRNATPAKENYTIPENFDFRKITGSRFGVHWGESEQSIKIWFSPSIAPLIIERQWHPSQQIQHNDDRSIVLSLTVNHTLELKTWILTWGKDAKVIEPKSFAQKMKSEIEEMIKNYRDQSIY